MPMGHRAVSAIFPRDPGLDVPLPEPDRGFLESRERVLSLKSTDALEDVAADLKRRQEAIERREAELDIREQVFATAKERLLVQIDRMEALRDEIASLIEEVDAAEEERLRQLVKVYETMKGKQAAAIFDRLDPNVLLKVAARMREAKLAAIMAKMEAPRARHLTAQLAREQELPELPPLR